MKKKPWTQEEIDSLKIGVFPPNRTAISIKNMRIRLGLVKFKASRWTKEHKDKLVELLQQGLSQKEIYKILPYSPKGIQKQVMRMNLQKNKQYKFTKKELKKFTDFLQENWKQKTPKELVDIWNQNNKKIGKNKVVYHLIKLGIKIPKDESLRLGFLKKKEQKIYKNSKTTIESANKIKALRIKLMRQRIEQNKDLWTGLPDYNVFDWSSEPEETYNG